MDPSHRYEGVKALLVDDNADLVDTLSVLLELMGCKTFVAYDGRTALQLFHHARPDVVFLDLDMPGLDGCDAAMLVQAEDAAGQTLLVCVTGRSEPADEERCRRAGFDFFFPKPLEEHQLHQVLEAAAARKAHTPAWPDRPTMPMPMPDPDPGMWTRHS